MYTSILNEDSVSFKELEQAIYESCCQLAREATIEVLKAIDDLLAQERDKSELRDKGYRKTTIKTVYGSVEYSRHAYLTQNEEGKNETIYLLDQELGMDTIGSISTNLAEKIACAAIDAPFRKASDLISQTTGQSISAGGVWNVVQALGEKLEKEEAGLVEAFHTGQTKGTRALRILFEEMDGVWIKGQGSGGSKAPAMEVKVGTMYEGWKKQTGNRSCLAGKTVMAGIESSEEFHERWEAKIESQYDPAQIGLRILNGDGGSWIHDEYDVNAIQQIDRFHVVKTIRLKVSHKEAAQEMLKYLNEDKIEELIDSAQIYYDSISTAEGDTKEETDAKELLDYLTRNKEYLAGYKARGVEIPAPPEGLVYKRMGVQENQNCTLITLRMKGKRKRWALQGANNMIRLLYYKENRELYDAIDRYTDGQVWSEPVKKELHAPLSAAKVAKVDGKGNNKYIDTINKRLPILGSSDSRTAEVFRRLSR